MDLWFTDYRRARLAFVALWAFTSGLCGCGSNGLMGKGEGTGNVEHRKVEELVGQPLFESLSCCLHTPFAHRKYPPGHSMTKELRNLLQWMWSMEDVSKTLQYSQDAGAYDFAFYEPDGKDRQGVTSGPQSIYFPVYRMGKRGFCVEIYIFNPPRDERQMPAKYYKKVVHLDHDQYDRIAAFLLRAVPEERPIGWRGPMKDRGKKTSTQKAGEGTNW